MTAPPRIDAHQHFWQLARGDYGWLTPDLAPLWRDFGPADLRPLLDACGIDRTILVQAAPTEAETRYLLHLAANEDTVAGVVGWCDFEAADAADGVARLASLPGLAGLRPMIQDIADPDWMLQDRLRPAFDAMLRHGLRFDALVRLVHLPRLLQLLQRHPGLPAVIDHGGKPDIAAAGLDARATAAWQAWAPWIARLGRETGAFCKLSGLLTEAGSNCTAETLRPWVDHLLDCFGPQRLIWGSDWPVVTLAASYRAWHDMSVALLGHLDPADRAALFGGNAARFYGLRP